MAAHTAITAPAVAPSLPPVGMSRWQQLRYLVCVSRETWRKMCLAGRAPAPIRLSERCTVWKNSDVHRWLQDPLNYRQEQEVV
jgi:prophage regulatory protein